MAGWAGWPKPAAASLAAALGAALGACVLALAPAALAPAAHAAGAPANPALSAATRNRRIVFAKTASGYRWKLATGPVPAIGPHQVLIHVRAVSINRDDLTELAPNPRAHLAGLTAGFDAVGVVVAVGRGVTRVRPGMRVTDSYFPRWIDGPPSARKLGATTRGVFADYIALGESDVVQVPKVLTDVEAATLPLAAVTAFNATIGQHVLRPGSIVLIEGTGGVSTFAMQFAAAVGARIIQTSSSDLKLERTQAIAKHESINYRTHPEWSRRVLALTGGHGADLIVDVGGKKTLPQAIQSLAYGGRLSIVGGLTGYGGDIPALALLGKVAGAQGIYVGSRADFSRTDAFIAAHHIRPVVSRVFPFRDFEQALAYLESGRFIGKVVLTLDPRDASSR